jgi:hypothetical protein
MVSLECAVCFDEVDQDSAIACPDGHLSCIHCVRRGLEISIGENKVFACPAASEADDKQCQKCFSDAGLEHAVGPLLKATHDLVVARNQVSLAFAGAPDDIVVKCPLCCGVVLLSKQTAAQIGFHEARKITCRFCLGSFCKKCDKPWHHGACDRQERADAQFVADLAISCICGNTFIRGDGCNRIKCNLCKRSWCWICKAYFEPGTADYVTHFRDSCPLYGERPPNQVFAARPVQPVPKKASGPKPRRALPPLRRRHGEPEYGREVTRQTPSGKSKTGHVCGALTNRGLPCQRQSLPGRMCGIHTRLDLERG